jgi:lipid II:glycine glycyltransferase (peptidoglycan interpeptide bridge formation enzyme)
MPLVSFAEWQSFLKSHPNAHILQTAEWGELKSAFGWDVLRIISGGEGLQILFRRLPLGFSIAYAPKPVSGMHLTQISAQLWAEIDALCRKKRAIFLKLEPDAWDSEFTNPASERWALLPSPHNIQPPRTVILSLVGSADDILGRMKQKCRYNIRLAEKKGITVRAWDDLDGFHQLIQVTGGRDGFGVHSLSYYRKAYELFHRAGMAELLLAEFESHPLAALMIFANGERSWYLYGASNDQERNRMPTYLLQWQAIKWAQERGCSTYDLWGVPDEAEAQLETQFETRQDGLWGVYRFKRGFGGQVKRAAQAVDRVYLPWFYRLYLWRMGKSE